MTCSGVAYTLGYLVVSITLWYVPACTQVSPECIHPRVTEHTLVSVREPMAHFGRYVDVFPLCLDIMSLSLCLCLCVFFPLNRYFYIYPSVDIQHNQCPCRIFSPRKDTSYVVTKLRHGDTTVRCPECSKHSGQCNAMSSYWIRETRHTHSMK